MGLDSIWVDEKKEPFRDVEFKPQLKLCGGMCSGHGIGSFRGKVYSKFIEDITDISLYQEFISNDIIKEMSVKINKYYNRVKKNKKRWKYKYDEYITLPQLKDLARMFKKYGEEGANLYGWW